MTRRCEIATPTGWRVIPFAELIVGMIFRLFEPDGSPVVDAEGVSRFRVVAPPVGDRIETEPVPETDAERAVREQGSYWPGDASPWREGMGRGLR